MEQLMDFLTPVEQKSLEGYQYIDGKYLNRMNIKPRNYLKFMYKYNYQLMAGGIITDTNDFPTVTVKSYEIGNNFYRIDLSKVFVFYKQNRSNLSRREFFEEMLKNLENGKIKTKKNISN